MNNKFAWNDAIARMNKNNSLKSLTKKLYPMWRDDRIKACLMYSACNTVGFSDFTTTANAEKQIEKYIDSIIIDMLYIKTNYGEWQIYLDKYDTYRFEDRKDYKLLKIVMYDREIDIKI